MSSVCVYQGVRLSVCIVVYEGVWSVSNPGRWLDNYDNEKERRICGREKRGRGFKIWRV